jgi:arylsulfatase
VHSIATDKDDPTVDPKFGRVGKQTVEDTGPLTIERMKDVDAQEFIPRALEFMRKAKDADKPFFVWLNTSRMHLYTHLNEKWRYAAEKFTHDEDLHGSGMLQHDHDVGLVLDFLKENGLEDDTIVWYSTDNGPEHSSWPHGGTSPFRAEKMTTYEGGVRVISMLRWPGVIKPNQILNGIQAHQDMFTSLAAAAGVANVAEKMEKEKKQYIDGVNNLDWWTGKAPDTARHHFLYYYESNITAVRMGRGRSTGDEGGLLRRTYQADPLLQPSQRSLRELRQQGLRRPHDAEDVLAVSSHDRTDRRTFEDTRNAYAGAGRRVVRYVHGRQ